MTLALGIEIGGTKLQVGIGLCDDTLITRVHQQVDASKGAEGIRSALPILIYDAIQKAGCSQNDLVGIGVGFGGPIDSKRGVTLVSHQIEGWDNFPLRDWLEDQWKIPAAIQNDASLAGYAEAKVGAGKGLQRVFYITIGSGIGGGWIVDNTIDEGQGLGAAEIGHTWVPDPESGEAEKLELICSGWSIGRRAREAIEVGEESLLQKLCCNNAEKIDAKMVYTAAEQDDLLANAILEETCTTLAIGICNVVALLNPQRIVIGGGVSLMGSLFWEQLKTRIKQYVFAPFANSFDVVPAALGQDVVIVGGVLLGQEISKN